ncbi:hypothetical protein GGS26DRAFT_443826 [Hypomontagnella submonticulosa]|nr:hypothetical protein GGS26DRAFT_443826 [Hypomontagnella submonticulosa]
MRIQPAIAFLLPIVRAWYDCPFPTCEKCLSIGAHDAPGIGFGIEFSYGTAAAHFYNGTVVNIAKVPPTLEYAELMARLSSLPHPPLETTLDRWRRSINKLLGRPATPDVDTLASMLAALRDATSTALASPIDRVVVTHPILPGLAVADLADALEHAGLRPWLGAGPAEPPAYAGLYPSKLTEGSAVFAAHGFGLCNDFGDLFECGEEEERMAVHTVLLAGLTRRDLRAEVVKLRAPFNLDQRILVSFVDVEAGLDQMERYATPDAFWAHTQKQLEAGVRQSSSPLTKVMLTGENATHPDFLAVLKDALARGGYSAGEGAIRLEVDERVGDPTFASARGAAQYARWRQEAPIGCKERRSCEEGREKARRSDNSQESKPERLELR